jgi:ribose-phosphate pyrophosphokinase
MDVIGDVSGKNAIIFDDMISTGGTMTQAAAALKERGAREVYAGVTHAVVSEKTRVNLKASPLKELAITDTVPQESFGSVERVKVLSVGELLGEAIRRIHEERSLSSLFI